LRTGFSRTLLRAGLSPAVAGNAFLVLDSYIYGYERQRTILARDDGGDSTDTAQDVGDAIPRAPSGAGGGGRSVR